MVADELVADELVADELVADELVTDELVGGDESRERPSPQPKTQLRKGLAPRERLGGRLELEGARTRHGPWTQSARP